MIKHLFFDLDGTLTDPKEGITKAANFALEHFGIKTENLDDLCKFIGPALVESFAEFYGFSKEDALIAQDKYREYFQDKGIYENMLYDGMKDVLSAVKDKGFTVILATMKPIVYAERILEHFEIREYFDFVSGVELDGRRNSKTEVIEYALTENNITDKAEVIMIGDRKHDIIGAKANGLRTLGVLYGYGSREELEGEGADDLVVTVNDLKAFLLEINS